MIQQIAHYFETQPVLKDHGDSLICSPKIRIEKRKSAAASVFFVCQGDSPQA